MNRRNGFTLVELVFVLALGGLLVATATAYSIPWMAREGLRGGIYDVHTTMQLARMEAVNRNRNCRFVVDTSARTLAVWDTKGTVPRADDTRLYRTTLPRSAMLATPDGSSSVTLLQFGGSIYEANFNSEGGVNGAGGTVSLFAGGRYGRVSLYTAGGTLIESWSGSAWQSGL